MTETQKAQEDLRRISEQLELAERRAAAEKAAGLKKTAGAKRGLATLRSLKQRLEEQIHSLTHKGRW